MTNAVVYAPQAVLGVSGSSFGASPAPQAVPQAAGFGCSLGASPAPHALPQADPAAKLNPFTRVYFMVKIVYKFGSKISVKSLIYNKLQELS